MQTATGTVKKIVYASQDMQVITLATNKRNVKVVFQKEHMHVESKDYIRVKGHLVDSKYGKQLVACEVDYTPVTHELISDFIRAAVGIGQATSQRLIDTFPDNLIHLIESNDIEALSAVPRVSKALATSLCILWREHGGKVELIQFMDTVLSNTNAKHRQALRSAAKKAFSVYQEDTVAKLQEDPYRIWVFTSFASADCLAKAMSIKDDDPRRLICAVEEVLYRQLKTGSTCVELALCKLKLETLLGGEYLAEQALQQVSSNDKERVVITENDDATTLALPGSAIMENYVAEQLRSRLSNNIMSIQATDRELSNYRLSNGRGLSDEQINAVKLILNNAVSVVSGGGGTGKTSVLHCANDIIKQSGNDVLQIALSGKASQRLIQQTQDDAYTIASLLKRIEIDAEFLDGYCMPVVHVDEASMVDLQSMYRILTVFENRPLRLVFIGDWAQLQPVGIGLIFHKLMKSDVVPRTELTKNFRSIKGVQIAANAIKQGEMFEPSKEVEIIQYEDNDELMCIMERQYYLHTFNDAEAHIIAARKSTVSEANVRIHRSFSAGRKVVAIAPQFREGDLVIYKKNDFELKLVNGSTGRIIGQTDLAMIVHFNYEGIKLLALDKIQKNYDGDYILQHAYAMTCHSSQGSEFDTAIVVVENFEMVERSWLYTAVTRAKKKVVLLVKDYAIEQALARGFGFEKIRVGFYL